MPKSSFYDKIPLFLKIPGLVFIASLVTGMIMASLVHFSINKASRDQVETMLKKQVPVIKQVLRSSARTGNFITAQNSIVSSDGNSALVVFNQKARPIFHSEPEVNKQVQRVLVDRFLSIKDVHLLKQTAIENITALNKSNASYKLSIKNRNSLMFLPFKSATESYYALVIARAAVSSYSLKVIISIYLIALLMSIVVAGFAFVGTREIPRPLSWVVRSLQRYQEEGRFVPIEAPAKDEVKDLFQQYNEIMQNISNSTGAPVGSKLAEVSHEIAEPPESLPAVTIRTNENEFELREQLQSVLHSRPFSKFKGVELAVYPRVPHTMSHCFLSADDSHINANFLFCHFDDNSIKGNVLKNRVQERFYALAAENATASPVAENIYEYLNDQTESGPGMLMLHFKPSDRSLHMVHSGPFFLFLVSDENEVAALTHGETYFERSYPGVENIDISRKKFLLILSSDVLAALNMNAEEIHEQFLVSLPAEQSGKNYLANLLNVIYSKSEALQSSDKLPGLVAVLNFRK